MTTIKHLGPEVNEQALREEMRHHLQPGGVIWAQVREGEKARLAKLYTTARYTKNKVLDFEVSVKLWKSQWLVEVTRPPIPKR